MPDTPGSAFRMETDSLGAVKVPAEAWYGAQTTRALQHFQVSGRGPDPDFVTAHILVKWAGAMANLRTGALPAALADPIIAACRRVADGEYRDQFMVDRFQAGAGTSHNMNSNEVLANLANVALGGEKGVYQPIHPNDHVNLGQSTNDTIPTAIRIAALLKLRALSPALISLSAVFRHLADRERNTLKAGRTHLQDAVPTTLGLEFEGYAWSIDRVRENLDTAAIALRQIGLGGTAVGTGIGTGQDFRSKVVEALAELAGEPLSPGHPVGQMQSMLDLVTFSGHLSHLAGEILRICNDLRLLASGPRTGLAEIAFPPVQPGSSIMPGKVNPVIPEMAMQTCYQVMAQYHAVAAMSQAGQLELNVTMPGIGSALFDQMEWLTRALPPLREALQGIRVNRERCAFYARTSVGLATLLSPALGYFRAAQIAREAESTGKELRDLVQEKGLMTADAFDDLVSQSARLPS